MGQECAGTHNRLLARIDKLVLVHRLRRVVALLGFTRFETVTPGKDGALDLDVSRAALAEPLSWLPAVEHRGEGAFVSFTPSAIGARLAREATTRRGRQIERAWRQGAEERPVKEDRLPGLPCILLHSLSHMLPTSIALDCGYRYEAEFPVPEEHQSKEGNRYLPDFYPSGGPEEWGRAYGPAGAHPGA